MAIQDSYYSDLYNQSGGTMYEQPQDPSFFSVGDMFQGAINGAEEALRSTFGLANYVNPFSEQRGDMVEMDIIDEPDTIMGQLVGGFAQYAVGAALVTGAITGGLALISSFLAISAGAAAGMGLAASTLKGVKGALGVTLKAQQWYRTGALGSGVGAKKAFEYAVQAPMIDFAAFGSDSGRFMDILNQNETTRNAFTEALASDEDDPVLWARAKNIMDGAIAGGMTDAAFAGLKHLARSMREVTGAQRGMHFDQTKELLTEEVTKMHAKADEAYARYNEGLDRNLQIDFLDDKTLRDMGFVADTVQFTDDATAAIDAWLDGYIDAGDVNSWLRLTEEMGGDQADAVFGLSARQRRSKAKKLHRDTTKTKWRGEVFKDGGMTWEDLGSFNAPLHVEDNLGNILTYGFYQSLDENAKKVLENGRARARGQDIPHPDLDMSVATEGPVAEAVSKMKKGDIHKWRAELLSDMEEMNLSVDVLAAQEHLSRIKDDPVAIVRLGIFANKSLQWANMLQAQSLEVLKRIDAAPDAKDMKALRQTFAMLQRTNFELMESSRKIYSNTGWSLRSAQNRMFGQGSPKQAKKNLIGRKFGMDLDGNDIVDRYNELILRADTDPNALREVELLESHIRESLTMGATPGERAEMIAKWSQNLNPSQITEHLVNVRTQNIISGAKTLDIAIWSPVFVEPYKAVRNIMGEVWMQTNPGARIDDMSIDKLVNVAQRELYTTVHSVNYAAQNFKGYLAAIGRSVTRVDPEALDTFHEGMKQAAQELRTGSRFAMDIGMTTKAQREAMIEHGNVSQWMLGQAMRFQHKLALGSRAIPGVDFAIQNAVGRARLEANLMFEALQKGADVRVARANARLRAEEMFANQHTLVKRYSADEILKKTTQDPEVVSGGVGFHQRLLENLHAAKADGDKFRVNMGDARMRAQGALLNNDPAELGTSWAKKLEDSGRTSDKLSESHLLGTDPLVARPDDSVLGPSKADWQQDRINRRLEDPNTAHVLGSEVVRKGTEVANDAARIIRKTPALRLFAPFLQVPINAAAVGLDVVVGGAFDNMLNGIYKSGARTVNLPGADSFMKLLRSPDPAVRMNAAVDGYIAAGAVGTFGMMLSQPGVGIPTPEHPLPLITGGGPNDPGQRKAMEAAGWAPYSIRMGDKYYSYQRIEPFASWLGMLADSVQIAYYHDAMNDYRGAEEALDAVTITGVTMLARSLTDKTFTKGLNDLFAIMTGDSERLKAWTREAVVSVSVPNSVRDVAAYMEGSDSDMKQTRSMIDKIYNSIPGMSSLLKDKRRNILGEPIKRTLIGDTPLVDAFIPANVRLVSDGQIEKEIAQIPNAWRSAPKIYKGVDTLDEAFRVDGQSLHDRWQERTSTITVRGKTLRQALRVLINEDQYQEIPPGLTPDGKYSPRAGMIEAVIRKYQTAAWKALMVDEPDVETATKAAKAAAKVRRNARSGRGVDLGSRTRSTILD